ncbi:MAG: glycosyltransferase [Butyrivibrio sp.]|nr:glycosyltransferase [Butyrivibrio sp.]
MNKPFFTVIVVSYNAGDNLIETVDSIWKQSCRDFRILIKDGMSTDGSIKKLREKYDVGIEGSAENKQIVLMESCDNGIYHAMNIAVSRLSEYEKPEGAPSYVFFLNCGDRFYDENVLKDVKDFINKRNSKKGTVIPAIFYGDIFDDVTGNRVASNPKIDDYALYRNVPSHQACFYDERLIFRNPFDLKYKVRADYEQFLRCYYREKADTVYVSRIVANYEGGGFSDQNKKISEEERREIITRYLPKSRIRKYDLLRVLTLSGLRTHLANGKLTAGAYNALKSSIYALKGRKKRK